MIHNIVERTTLTCFTYIFSEPTQIFLNLLKKWKKYEEEKISLKVATFVSLESYIGALSEKLIFKNFGLNHRQLLYKETIFEPLQAKQKVK